MTIEEINAIESEVLAKLQWGRVSMELADFNRLVAHAKGALEAVAALEMFNERQRGEIVGLKEDLVAAKRVEAIGKVHSGAPNPFGPPRIDR
jgi:hypothetical protein